MSFLGFTLNPDPVTRPDIYQVAHVAFKLIGRNNPVLNTNVSLA